MTSARLDIVNRHKALLCEFYGCRKHTQLRQVYNGRFCDEHRKVMGLLRSTLLQTKDLLPEQKLPQHWLREYALRYVESLLRKRNDSEHSFYLQSLEASLSSKLL